MMTKEIVVWKPSGQTCSGLNSINASPSGMIQASAPFPCSAAVSVVARPDYMVLKDG